MTLKINKNSELHIFHLLSFSPLLMKVFKDKRFYEVEAQLQVAQCNTIPLSVKNRKIFLRIINTLYSLTRKSEETQSFVFQKKLFLVRAMKNKGKNITVQPHVPTFKREICCSGSLVRNLSRQRAKYLCLNFKKCLLNTCQTTCLI